MSLRKRVELVALGQDHAYSIGVIEVTGEGDVYFISKGKFAAGKTSRHASGEMHVDLANNKRMKFGEMTSLAELGIEFLAGIGLSLDILPDVYKKWRGKNRKKRDDVFFIDIRHCGKSTVMVSVGIFVDEGLNRFLARKASFAVILCKMSVTIQITYAMYCSIAVEIAYNAVKHK